MLQINPRKDLDPQEQQAVTQLVVIRTAASLRNSSHDARTLVGAQHFAPYNQNDSQFAVLIQLLLCSVLATVQSVPGNPEDWAYRPPGGR